MTSLTRFDFNDSNIAFENRNGQIWVNLTDMARASGKKVNDWNRLQSTQEYLTALEINAGIPVVSIASQGGGTFNTGTWAIDEVAIEFASWCSIEFKIWINRQIKILMNIGNLSLNSETVKPETDTRYLQALQQLLETQQELILTQKQLIHNSKTQPVKNVKSSEPLKTTDVKFRNLKFSVTQKAKNKKFVTLKNIGRMFSKRFNNSDLMKLRVFVIQKVSEGLIDTANDGYFEFNDCLIQTVQKFIEDNYL